MRLLLLSAVLGSACGACSAVQPHTTPEPEPQPEPQLPPRHDASACYRSSEPLWELDTGLGEVSALFAGQVVDLEPARTELHGERCQGASQAIELETTNGSRLVLAWGWPDAPAASLALGDSVEGIVRHVAQHGTATGFVLRRDSVLIAAVEVGTWGPALQPADHDEITVSAGDRLDAAPDPCGEISSVQLRFSGDEEVRVAPTGSAELTAAGQPLLAFSLASERRLADNGRCADHVDETSWALLQPR